MIKNKKSILILMSGLIAVILTGSYILKNRLEKTTDMPTFSLSSFKTNPNVIGDYQLIDLQNLNELIEMKEHIILAECIAVSSFNENTNIYEFRVDEQIKGSIDTETIDVYVNAVNENYNVGDQHFLFLGSFDSALYSRTVFSTSHFVINTTQMTVTDEYGYKLAKEIEGKTIDEIKSYINDLPGTKNITKSFPSEVQDYAESVEALIETSDVVAYISVNDLEYVNPAVSNAIIEFHHFYKGECNTDRILIPSETKPGQYLVFLQHDSGNWYRLVTRYDSLIPMEDENDALDYLNYE